MKKLISAVIAAGMLVTLCGCSVPGRELSDTLIIQGIAVDTVDNGYKVTVEALNNSKNASVNGEGAGEKISKFYEAEDENIAVAFEKVCMLSGKEPLYSHNRVIVFGEPAAKLGLDRVLDFFIREYNTRATIPVAVAKGGEGGELLRADPGKDVVHAQMIEDVISFATSRSQVLKARVLDAANMVLDDNSALAVPALIVHGEGGEKCVTVAGTAIFDEDNILCDYLEPDESFGFVLLNDKAEKGMLSVDLGTEYTLAFAIEKLKTKMDVSYDGENVSFSFVLDAECDVSEYTVPGGYGEIDRETVYKLKKLCEQRLTDISLKCIEHVSGRFALDCFGLSRRMRLKYTDDYRELSDDWESVLQKASYSVEVNVTIRRLGEETFV